MCSVCAANVQRTCSIRAAYVQRMCNVCATYVCSVCAAYVQRMCSVCAAYVTDRITIISGGNVVLDGRRKQSKSIQRGLINAHSDLN